MSTYLVTVSYVNRDFRYVVHADSRAEAIRAVRDCGPHCSPSITAEPFGVAVERGHIKNIVEIR